MQARTRMELHELLKVPSGCGVRRQSAAATALWILSERPGNRRIKARQVRRIQSGVALRFPPRSKTMAHCPTERVQQMYFARFKSSWQERYS